MGAYKRTGRQYFSEMPKNIGKRWTNGRRSISRTESAESYFLDKNFSSFREFILASFQWSGTEEGTLYWDSVSRQKFNEANDMVEPKTSIKGTIVFISLILLLLGFYAIVWSAFFRKESPIRKATHQKFVPVIVWEKADTMDMIYADKNAKVK